MVKIEELRVLFQQEDLTKLIYEGGQYLKNYPEDVEVLFMLAIAHYDRVYIDDDERLFEVLEQDVLPLLKKIIHLDAEHVQALYAILDFTLKNESALVQKHAKQRHISPSCVQEYIDFAQQLIFSQDQALAGYNFLIQIYTLVNDPHKALEVIDQAIAFCYKTFSTDREINEYHTSIFFHRKIQLLYQQELASPQDILNLLKTHIRNFASSDDLHYLNFAEIAYELEDLNLALRYLLKLVRGINDEDVLAGFVKWHNRLAALIQKGLVHADAYYFQLIIERNHFEFLGLKADSYYQHSLELIKNHPDSFAAYHFAGTYLYESNRMQEALPLLKEALQLDVNSVTWRRYVLCKYVLTSEIDTTVPDFKDLPRDLYNDAVELEDAVRDKVLNEEQLHAFRSIRAQLYQQSFDAFQAYYEQNEYESDYLGTKHNWAMCCNNYAIVLEEQEAYALAAEVAQIGLQHSDFEELHISLIDALMKLEDYAAAQSALLIYFKKYEIENAKFYHFQKNKANYLITLKALHEGGNIREQAQDLLLELYDHYNEKLDISDYDYRDYEAAKNAVEGLLYEFYDVETLANKIDYYKSIVQAYPHEPHAHYVLMQLHNENEDYEQVNQSALLYLKYKKDFMIHAFDHAKTIYLITKTYYLLDQHESGIHYFNKNDAFLEQTFEAPEYLQWLLYGVKLLASGNKLQLLLQYESKINQIYAKEGWTYDDMTEEINLIIAHLYYQQGDLKQAHQRLDLVLSYSDHSSLAEEYKKNWKKPGLFSKFF